MRGFHNTLGENDVMAYLVMMAPRLFHLHRVLKPTGSLYLHCDPTASAYLRLILDAVFGARSFRNEIIWKRTSSHSDAKRFGAIHDTIYFYSKSAKDWTWNKQYTPRDETALKTHDLARDPDGRTYRLGDMSAAGQGPARMFNDQLLEPPSGNHWRFSQENIDTLLAQKRIVFTRNGTPRYKRYLDETPGFTLQDVWNDLNPINAGSKEKLGYPTQKPLALLERIVSASSNPGDVVMDPFCGCGTAVVAAQKLGRQWIGIDITPIATSLVQKRLFDAFEARDSRLLAADDAQAQARAFRVEGLPTDEAGARAMFEADHKKFEMWAVGLIPAIPQEKKGADGGIDGVAFFDVGGKDLAKAVVQVKGGKNIGSAGVQQLRGAMGKNGAPLGFYVSLEAPTRPMLAEALAAGFYKAPTGVGRQVPALQVRTIAELLSGHDFDFPVTGANASFRQAAAIAQAAGQGSLGLD